MSLLEVQDLEITFGRSLAAVRGLSLTLQPGETHCLVGESGCGKSLSALAVMDLLPRKAVVRAKRLALGGEDLLAMSARRRARARRPRATPTGRQASRARHLDVDAPRRRSVCRRRSSSARAWCSVASSIRRSCSSCTATARSSAPSSESTDSAAVAPTAVVAASTQVATSAATVGAVPAGCDPPGWDSPGSRCSNMCSKIPKGCDSQASAPTVERRRTAGPSAVIGSGSGPSGEPR